VRSFAPQLWEQEHLSEMPTRTKALARRTLPERGAASGFVLVGFPDALSFAILPGGLNDG